MRLGLVHEPHRLYRCAAGSDSFVAEFAAGDARLAALDPRDAALVGIGALAALGAPDPLWSRAIAGALEAGAQAEDIVAALTTVATTIGHARVASAAPAIALGLGYDVDEALHR